MGLRNWARGGDGLPPLIGPDDFHLDLCGKIVAASSLRTALFLMGDPRTGKTSIIEGLLREAVRRRLPVLSVDFEGNQAHRLREVAPPGYRVHRVDVTVKGGTGIDWAAFLRTLTDRDRFRSKLSPVRGHQNDYFDAMAGEIILAAASLCEYWSQLAGGEYTLADVVRMADDMFILSELGKEVPKIGDPYAILGETGRPSREVRATVRTKLQPWMIYASLSLNAAEAINPLEILEPGKAAAVVLVFSDVYKHVLDKAYSFLCDTFAYVKLSRPGSGFVFLNYDECPSLERLESLVDISRRGAKTGLVTIASAHSPEGMEKKFGREDASDVMSLPARHVVLKVNGERASNFGSFLMGEQEVLDRNPPDYVLGGPQDGDKLEGGIRPRRNVTPDEIRRLPLASWERDEITGYIDEPGGARKFTMKFRHLVQTSTPPPVLEPAHPGWEELPSFTLADYDRLKFDLKCVERAERRRAAAGKPRRRKP